MAPQSESSGDSLESETTSTLPSTTRNSSFTSNGDSVGALTEKAVDDHDITDGTEDKLQESIEGSDEKITDSSDDVVDPVAEGDEAQSSRPFRPKPLQREGSHVHASQAASYLRSIEQRLQFLEARLSQLDPEFVNKSNEEAQLNGLGAGDGQTYEYIMENPGGPPITDEKIEGEPTPELDADAKSVASSRDSWYPTPIPSPKLVSCDDDFYYTPEKERPFTMDVEFVRLPPAKFKAWNKTRIQVPPIIHAAITVETQNSDPEAVLSATHHVDENAKDGANTPAVHHDDTEVPGIPVRVAFGSVKLMEEISNISGTKVTDAKNVVVKPFKMLVAFEEKIRKRQKEEHDKYHRLVTQAIKEYKEATPEVDEEADPAVDKDKETSTSSDDPGTATLEPSEKEEKTAGSVVDEDTKASKEPEPKKKKKKHCFYETEDIKTALKLKNDLFCLVHLLDTDLKPLCDLRKSIEAETIKTIAHEDLWHLFQPGDLVISRGFKPRAYRVLHVTGGRPFLDREWKPPASADIDEPRQANRYTKVSPLRLDCFYIDFDGKFFGPTPHVFEINPYEGKKAIESLEVHPLRFDAERGTVLDMLEKRGRRFVELAHISHKRYTGLSLKEPPMFERTEELDSDVVIDFTMAYQTRSRTDIDKELDPPLMNGGVVETPTRGDRRETFEIATCSLAGCNECTNNHDDASLDLRQRSEYLSKSDLLSNLEIGKDTLTREQLILLPLRVFGYVLLNRCFYPLDVDLIEDIVDADRTKSMDGFEDLVIDADHKRIVKALVKTHTRGPRTTLSSGDVKTLRAPERQIDLVRGKGRGLIILLHGVPGVGKTSTAECVAAATKRPLFPITCGDISGESAREVEQSLEKYFELAHKWGCVLLLDEADVFLAKRRRGDIKQNSLVSVFLRVLEYYSGILILTTNRVGEFDEAIKSRIHISLYYKPLDRDSTLKVWKMNLSRLKRENQKPPPHRQIDFDPKEIMDFARGHYNEGNRWNGRQIKNAFQTAIALAEWDLSESADPTDMASLEKKHFMDVAVASSHFDQYLKKVRGGRSDAQVAKENQVRRDDYDEVGTSTKFGVKFSKKKAKRERGRGRGSDDDEEEEEEDQEEEEEEEEEESDRCIFLSGNDTLC
ncbi:hypothetical protein VTL71DRAFT_11739 [Oculimacula yallundae]|uniref:AAA+ ATPase domain-containing protein n=1 Tax=Oculimacula yallundae TaxID=86028 RepID=A0ABR4CSL8_9HELO